MAKCYLRVPFQILPPQFFFFSTSSTNCKTHLLDFPSIESEPSELQINSLHCTWFLIQKQSNIVGFIMFYYLAEDTNAFCYLYYITWLLSEWLNGLAVSLSHKTAWAVFVSNLFWACWISDEVLCISCCYTTGRYGCIVLLNRINL